MQRVAQDWLVLTQLTHNNASALGLVMALQFGPQMLMLPFSGFAADFFDRRKLLMATQAAMGLCALGLGLLTVTGIVQLWHVYVFAFLHGCAAAFDAPARQTFVSDLVGEADLPNAVALNSTSFNAARMVGPALAGLLIAGVGTGWAFLANALSFGGVLCSLMFLRVGDLHPSRRAVRAPGRLRRGLPLRLEPPRPPGDPSHAVPDRHVRHELLDLHLDHGGHVFHAGAGGYGLLASMMAIGTITGALLAAGRERPRIELLLSGAAIFALGCALAAIMPNYWLFGATLVVIGVSALTVTNSTQQPDATVDRARDARSRDGDSPRHRARRHADRRAARRLGRRPVRPALGPRRRRGGGTVGAAIVMIHYLAKYRRLRVHVAGGRLRFSMDEGEAFSLPR